jgi:nitroreductase
MKKPAQTDYPVLEVVETRWSPRAFAGRDIEEAKLRSCLEAARWAPSCFNEQPWRFVVARKTETEAFERLAGCLRSGNSWAREAAVLLLSVAANNFSANGKPNRHAVHDVGLATAQFVLQATALDLAVHQMAGFDRDQARDAVSIPQDFEPVTMIAVGYPGEPGQLSEELRQKELSARTRRPQGEFVFGGLWGAVCD